MFLLSLSAAAQNQYYVSTTGSDSNSGTSPSARWKTISHAIASASLTGGATIHVAGGTYTENVSGSGYGSPIWVNRSGPSTSQRLRVQCDDQWSVPSGAGCLLRNSASSAGIVVTGSNVDVVGFDYSQPNSGAGVVVRCGGTTSGQCAQGNSVHIINNYLHDIAQNVNDSLGGPGCPSFGAIFVGTTLHGTTAFQSDSQIIGNRIYNYGDQSKAFRNGGSCNYAHGIYANNPGTVVENNVIIQALSYGIHLYSAPCKAVISNNTVDQSGRADIILGGGDCSPQGTITVDNNILEGGPAGAIVLGAGGVAPCTSGTRIKISNNLFRSSSNQVAGNLNGCTDVSGSLVEAPTTTFVSYSAGGNSDYNLKTGSAAIGRGTTACVSGILSCVNAIDIAGITRATPPSIGSYEFGSVSSESPAAPSGLTASVQ